MGGWETQKVIRTSDIEGISDTRCIRCWLQNKGESSHITLQPWKTTSALYLILHLQLILKKIGKFLYSVHQQEARSRFLQGDFCIAVPYLVTRKFISLPKSWMRVELPSWIRVKKSEVALAWFMWVPVL